MLFSQTIPLSISEVSLHVLSQIQMSGQPKDASAMGVGNGSHSMIWWRLAGSLIGLKAASWMSKMIGKNPGVPSILRDFQNDHLGANIRPCLPTRTGYLQTTQAFLKTEVVSGNIAQFHFP